MFAIFIVMKPYLRTQHLFSKMMLSLISDHFKKLKNHKTCEICEILRKNCEFFSNLIAKATSSFQIDVVIDPLKLKNTNNHVNFADFSTFTFIKISLISQEGKRLNVLNFSNLNPIISK